MTEFQRGGLEERAKLEWLRGAVRDGIDQIDRGEVREFESIDELDRHIDQLGTEAAALAARYARPNKGRSI